MLPFGRAVLGLVIGAISNIGAGIGSGGLDARAQDQPPRAVEKVVVTGSRIPRPDARAASPIASYDAEAVAAHGALSLEDFLNAQPQFTPDFNRTSNNPGDGVSFANLRALGSNRTLVLLNGRRLAPPGVQSAADLNVIPAAIVERIDVITGGESAVYGSDAVAGVVNLITRRNFEGVSFTWQNDIYGTGDGEVNSLSLAWGAHAQDGRAQILVFGDYLERDDVLYADRDFTRNQIGDDKETGQLFAGGSGITPSGGITTPGVINGVLTGTLVFEPDGSLRARVFPNDLYNFAPDNYLQTPLTRVSAGALGRIEVWPETEAYAELLYAQPHVDSRLAPSPFSERIRVPIAAPFFKDQSRQVLRDNYDPDGDGIASFSFRRRLSEAGPRFFERSRDYYRAATGLRGDVEGWSWSLDYSYARNETATELRNAASLSRLLQGIAVDPLTGLCANPSGGCAPVDLFGEGKLSAEGAEFIRVDQVSEITEVEQQVVTASVAGDVVPLFGEMVGASLGAEWRRIQTAYEPAAALFTGDALGFNAQQPVRGAFEMRELFAEALVPLLTDAPFAQRLEFEAGARFSDHSTAGSNWTWKLGGQWRPTEDLRLRAMQQRAVRAPNVGELFEAALVEEGRLDFKSDFCRAAANPAGSGFADVCVAQGMDASQIGVFNPTFNYSYDAVFAGNAELKPESADTFTAGFDWTFGDPWRVQAGADYFLIEIVDVIGRVDALTACAFAADPREPACGLIKRAPDGFIAQINDIPLNLASAEVEGVDFNLVLHGPAPTWAALTPDAKIELDVRVTHYLRQAASSSEFATAFDCVGYFACGTYDLQGATTPATTAITTARYELEDFALQTRWRWIDGMDNVWSVRNDALGFAPILAIPHINHVSYVDVAMQWQMTAYLRLRAGVDNVFEAEPPLLASDQVQANTDPSRYDVFGRRFFFTVDVRFED